LTDAQLAERFEAFHATIALSPGSCGALPPSCPSDLISDEVRERIHGLTSGVTARIFRLIATVAEEAVRSGKERLDFESFAEDPLLPLVSMTQSAARRTPRVAAR